MCNIKVKEDFSLGARIKEYRKKRGLSQAEFARRIGKSTSTVYGYETDHIVPSPETLTLISAILSTSIATLLDLEEDLVDEKSVWECLAKIHTKNKGKKNEEI